MSKFFGINWIKKVNYSVIVYIHLGHLPIYIGIEKPAVEIADGAVNFPGANIPCGEMVRFRAAKFFKRINSTRCKYRRNFDAKFSCGDTS